MRQFTPETVSPQSKYPGILLILRRGLQHRRRQQLNPIGTNVEVFGYGFDENGNQYNGSGKKYMIAVPRVTAANQMILNAGKNYTFVAVSYNTTTAPVFNAAATTLNNVANTIAVDNASDYLYILTVDQLIYIYGQQNYIQYRF